MTMTPTKLIIIMLALFTCVVIASVVSHSASQALDQRAYDVQVQEAQDLKDIREALNGYDMTTINRYGTMQKQYVAESVARDAKDAINAVEMRKIIMQGWR
jgi:hypothetical protein